MTMTADDLAANYMVNVTLLRGENGDERVMTTHGPFTRKGAEIFAARAAPAVIECGASLGIQKLGDR